MTANRTGSMRCETHVQFFLKVVLQDSLKRAKALLERPANTVAILMEDSAPGHLGDVDKHLQLQGSADCDGWKEKRKLQLQALKVHRAIIPHKGTPYLCCNDHVHQICHARLGECQSIAIA